MSMNDEFSIEKFSPAKQEVLKLVEESKAVDVSDVVAVKKSRLSLRDMRIAINKKGKDLREGALKFQKAVIERERELTDIIEPEEDRLQLIEDEYKLKKEMETRRSELPSRIEALKSIGDGVDVEDEVLLQMDDNEFNVYRVTRIEAKLRKEQEEFEAEKKRAALEEEEKRKKQQEIDDAAREGERKKLNDERLEIEKEKARMEGEKKAKQDAENEARMKEEKAKAEAEEKARLEKVREMEEGYQAYLKEVGFNPETDKVISDGSKTDIYKLIGTYIWK